VEAFAYPAQPVQAILAAMLVHPREKGSGRLRFCRHFVEVISDALTVYTVLMRMPDGVGAVALAACYRGETTPPFAAGSDPVRQAGPPEVSAAWQPFLGGGMPGTFRKVFAERGHKT
jgi:hypothetical protein